jgi:hypothetical protein
MEVRAMKRRAQPAAVRALVDGRTAVDEFGELATLKREAEAKAAKRGHVIDAWHLRGMHDPAGRQGFCLKCGAATVVTTDPKPGLGAIYGWTLTRDCRRES